MKTKVKNSINIFLLVAGVGTVIFSVFQLVNGMSSSSPDRIDGQEIVVVAENTPSAPLLPASTTVVATGQPTDSPKTGVGKLPESKSLSPTSIPTVITGTSKSSLDGFDTFLSQADAPVPVDSGYPPVIPDRIVIPSIQLNAAVIVAESQKVKIGDQTFDQWVAPNQFAAGWHGNSASLAGTGNTVINGHHNEYGKVFGHLIDLLPGETIYVYSNGKAFPYIISNKMILKEKNTDLQTRLQNASWIQPTTDKRLTLITCWPPETNTHRLIIVAIPYYFSPERVFG